MPVIQISAIRGYSGGGWEGIRTPGALRHTRFPGVHNRPLCHPSINLILILLLVLGVRA